MPEPAPQERLVPPVALHWTDLRANDDEVRACAAVLADDERARADSFVDATAQRRFVVRRAFLRRVLGLRLGMIPRKVALVADARGKPCVPGNALHFSTSHSGEIGAVAVSIEGDVGVDIETVRHLPDVHGLVELHLADSEARRVRAAAGDASHAFLRHWSAKEAYVKATGEGLRRPLREVELEVSTLPGRIVGAPGWRLFPISAPGLVGWICCG